MLIGTHPAATRLAGNSGSLAVAAATLFQPLRRRVQQAVDRRYDVARILEAFAAGPRDPVAAPSFPRSGSQRPCSLR